MAGSKLDVVNQALVRIGTERVASLSDLGAEAVAATEMYDTVVGDLMTSTLWNFAMNGQRLAQNNSPPSKPTFPQFDYVYQLPADWLRVVGLTSKMKFQLETSRLHTNDEEAYLVYVRDVTQLPQYWPPYFENLAVLELAGAFAISVTDQTSRAELYQSKSLAAYRRALSIDGVQTPPEVYELMQIYTRPTTNPLATA